MRGSDAQRIPAERPAHYEQMGGYAELPRAGTTCPGSKHSAYRQTELVNYRIENYDQ